MSAPGIMPSWPRIEFQVAFNAGVSGGTTPHWVDLSPRLRGQWSAEQAGRQYEMDQVQSGTLTVQLADTDGWLDPLNTASPFYPNVLPLRPCQLTLTWPPSVNVAPQNPSRGISTRWVATAGTVGTLITGLAASGAGQTTAQVWTIAAGAASGSEWSYGTTDGTQVDSFSATVTAGATYTYSAYMSRPAAGGDATVNLRAGIRWYRLDGTVISTSLGSSTTIPRQTSWARATVTATAPAGAYWGRILSQTTATTVAASVVYSTGLQFEAAGSASTWVDPGLKVSLWTGYVERWPQRWDYSGTYGLVEITGIDLLAVLATKTLSPSLQAQLQSLNPRRLLPLSEPRGSGAFRDVAASGQYRWALEGDSPFGAGVIDAGTAVEGGGSYGNPGPVVRLTNPNAGSIASSAGSFLGLQQPGPPTTGAWTRTICFRTTTAVPAGGAALLWGAIGGSNNGETGLYIDDGGHVVGYVRSPAGNQITIGVPGASVVDGRWHMATVSISADGKTCVASVDGVAWFLTSASDCRPGVCTSDGIGGYSNSLNGYAIWWFQGDVAFAAEFPTQLSVNDLSSLGRGFAAGWAGEDSRTRTQRILDLAGYPGAWGVRARQLAGAFGGAGSDAMAALQLIADSEGGQVVVDGTGTLWVYGDRYRWLQTAPTVTFGESAAGGEIPYLGDVAIDFDSAHISNEVTISNSGAGGLDSTTSVVAQDVTSRTTYSPHSLSRSTNLNDDNTAAGLAGGLLFALKDPHPRVSALTVDTSSYPAALTALTAPGFGFGSRVRLIRRPPGAPAITLDQYVEKISWAGDSSGRMQWRAQLTAAPVDPWMVLASLHTTLVGSPSVGATSVTVNALSGSALNPARAVLPVGTVLTLGYGTANAEDVTVTSVAATSPGYTTVALGVTATTKTHAGGDMVCQPLPAAVVLPPSTTFPLGLDAGATLTATGPRIAY